MKNMIELEKTFMKPLFLKGLRRYFHPNGELFLDVNMKNGDLGKKQKN